LDQNKPAFFQAASIASIFGKISDGLTTDDPTGFRLGISAKFPQKLDFAVI
jgi:hypothetical protein